MRLTHVAVCSLLPRGRSFLNVSQNYLTGLITDRDSDFILDDNCFEYEGECLYSNRPICPCYNVPRMVQSEVATLMVLYAATNGDMWLDNSGWREYAAAVAAGANATQDPCRNGWFGVMCYEMTYSPNVTNRV